MSMEIILIGGVILTAAVLAGIILNYFPVVRRYTVRSEKVVSPFAAVHISDLHECRFGKGQKRILSAVAALKPDLIFITGDTVEDGKEQYDEERLIPEGNAARELFCGLVQIAPCYAVFGNHESNIPYTDRLAADIRALGVNLLYRDKGAGDDPTAGAVTGGCEVLICGADDPFFDREKGTFGKRKSILRRILEDRGIDGNGKDVWRTRLRREYADVVTDGRLTVLLSHRPEEHELYRELGFDVVFSGHAHGGQWRFPPFNNGIFAPEQGFFPDHAGGFYPLGKTAHVVSRGLSIKRMIRIFNRPEICFVTFEPLP